MQCAGNANINVSFQVNAGFEQILFPWHTWARWKGFENNRVWEAQLHQPRLWFITAGYLVKRWFIPAAARARGQFNDLNREMMASNLFNCHKEVINAPPVPSISRCIHIVYRHKSVWEYQWSNFIYNCMSTFLHYVRCKDALLNCSAPGGERCESLTWVDEISAIRPGLPCGQGWGGNFSRGQPPQDDSVGSRVVWLTGLFSLWEQRRQAMLQLHLNDQQFNCPQRCDLY